MGELNPWKKKLLPKIVKSKGAVSPAMRATPSNVPVSKPLLAAGKITLSVVRHLCTPNANDASRTELGTNFRDSSVVRSYNGNKNHCQRNGTCQRRVAASNIKYY